jgi:hypothetical protein
MSGDRAVSTSRHPLPGGQTELEALGSIEYTPGRSAPYFSAFSIEARHKVFDNKFFLKYIQ